MVSHVQNFDLIASLRPEARDAPFSGLIEIFNYGREKEGLIPLWAGEGDLPTPSFICDAATRSLAAGDTFYTVQKGLPHLREALAAYHTRLYGKEFAAERFIVCGAGMQAIFLAVQATAGAGSSVVVPTPAWPNAAAAVGLMGAEPIEVPMDYTQNGWTLDLDKLFDACRPDTRAIFINSPCNPTGWVMSEEELKTVADFARERNIWIFADEIYARFVFDGERSPSFHDVTEPDDKILYVNTFSKNWAMTGWRIGWIEVPESLASTFENLVQYNTSGVAAFMQNAAYVALTQGEDFVKHQIERSKKSKIIISEALSSSNRIEYTPPDGAFYAFFRIDGMPDTGEVAKRLVDEAGLGIAPGTAFGAGGEDFLRLCFARKPDDIDEVASRLKDWLAKY